MDPLDRRRFARQLLLVEIGETGQRALCASAVRLPAAESERAAAVARVYLERAGCAVLAPGQAVPAGARAIDATLPDPEALPAIGRGPGLGEAEAALRGALLAVEAIKRALATRPERGDAP